MTSIEIRQMERETAINIAEEAAKFGEVDTWIHWTERAEEIDRIIAEMEACTMPEPNRDATEQEAYEYLKEMQSRGENTDIPLTSNWFRAASRLFDETEES